MSVDTGDSENCIFCKIIRGEAEASFLYRGDTVSAFLDTNPLYEGHALIVPNKHFRDIHDIPEFELSEVMKVTKIISKMMAVNLKADGVNVMHSTGRPAGQTIFHFHVHLLPRKYGDDDSFQKWWFSRTHRTTREDLDLLAVKIVGRNI